MIHVNIIGTGNVAWHLAKRFETLSSVRLQQVCGRSPTALSLFTDLARKTVTLSKLKPADITIIAVSDDAVESISEAIPFTDHLVVHTSGSIPMEALSDKNRKGVFYLVQSFSIADVVDFKSIPICLEYENPQDKDIMGGLALALSENIHILKSKQRKELHLAAVFANNFTNYCYTIAKEICDTQGIPFSLLHPLMLKTTTKAVAHEPKEMQTGPARRGDAAVIKNQLETLEEDHHKELYKTMTALIKQHYGKEL
ncbi:MAG: putative short-subunit dehydrogenase-like oxidoreductase (DUF2520 family) [Flavobacteriales bacterium]